MNRGRQSWPGVRPLGGVALLAVILAVVGPDAAIAALRSVDARSLVAGSLVAAVTTITAAWRWRLVSRRLGAELSLRSAVAECYRAQFLNATLPGGVAGDVGRGVRYGRSIDDLGRGLRSVAWERAWGQLVLVLCAAPVVLIEARRMPWAGPPFRIQLLALAGGVGATLAGWHWAPGLAVRIRRTLTDDARALLAPTASVPVLVASVVVLAGHVATFRLAAQVVGASIDEGRLISVALVVLLLGGIPLNIAGWGPREGAAAWAFAAAGWGSATGLAVAVAYGTIALVATLPGAAVLLVTRSRRRPLPAQALGPADRAGHPPAEIRGLGTDG